MTGFRQGFSKIFASLCFGSVNFVNCVFLLSTEAVKAYSPNSHRITNELFNTVNNANCVFFLSTEAARAYSPGPKPSRITKESFYHADDADSTMSERTDRDVVCISCQ